MSKDNNAKKNELEYDIVSAVFIKEVVQLFPDRHYESEASYN